MGRSSDFSQEMADLICEGISSGLSLRQICAEDDMPDKATVFRWLSRDETFRDQYARAREAQSDAMLEDILDIADQYDNLQDKLDVEHIQRAKLRIDTRKWAMSKLSPKRYGDKVTLGGDPDNPINHKVEMDAERFTRAIAGLAARSGAGGGSGKADT